MIYNFSMQDFLAILSKVSRGSVQEKLHWIFGLYDLNKDGVITKKEMQDVVHSIYSMLGRHTNPHVDDQSAKDHVDRIFHVSCLLMIFLYQINIMLSATYRMIFIFYAQYSLF